MSNDTTLNCPEFRLRSEDIGPIFKYYIVFNVSYSIVDCSDAIKNMYKIPIGGHLLDHISISSPEYDVNDVYSLTGKYCSLNETQPGPDTSVTLYGKVCFLKEARQLIFIGLPKPPGEIDLAFLKGMPETGDEGISATLNLHPDFPLLAKCSETLNGVVVTDRAGGIQWVSKDFEHCVGYSANDRADMSPERIVYGTTSSGLYRSYVEDRLVKKGKFSFLDVAYNQYGKFFWFRTTITQLFDKDNNITGRAYEFEDISTRKISVDALYKTESKLNTTDAILKALIDNFTSSIVFENVEREVVIANKPLFNLVRNFIPNEDIIGQKTTDILFSMRSIFQQPEAELDNIEKIVANGLASVHTVLLANGITLKQHFIPIKEAGETAGYLWIYEDITESLDNERRLNENIEKEKALNQTKSKFIRIASHELRTPLSVILSNTELLEMSLDPQYASLKLVKHEDLLKRIITEVILMEELLNELMVVSKIESGSFMLKRQKVNIRAFVGSIISELYQPYADGRYLDSLTMNLLLEEVDIDPKLIRHALVNLLNNAFKYSSKRSSPLFFVETTEDKILFRITDFGIGIPEKDKDNLFSTFYRASNVGAIQGTGVGLTVVQYVANMHGGSISYESVDNAGTTFWLTIPIDK